MHLRHVVLALCCWTVAVWCELTIADLPPCGLTCLLSTIPASGCGLTDTACQCGSKDLAQKSSQCLLMNCTMQDSLTVAKVQASICNLPSVDQSQKVMAVSWTLAILAAAFVIMRVVTKGILSGSFGLDDLIIVFALVLLIPVLYFLVKMCHFGFGKHLWDLQDGDLLRVLENFYIAETIYVVILSLVKVSILVFYLTVFPHPLFRRAVFGAIGFVVSSTAIIFFLTVFQCKPVQYFWNRDLDGTCMDINALAYANSAMSIIQDVLVIVLPIPILSKLQLGRKKKLGVVLMFAVGSFGCVVSMVRLQSLLVFGNSIDPTWDYTMAVVWTGVEMGVAMICACFPALRRLLVKLFPTIFASTKQQSSTNQQTFKSWYISQHSKSTKDAGKFVELGNTSSNQWTVSEGSPVFDNHNAKGNAKGHAEGDSGNYIAKPPVPIPRSTWFDEDSR